MEPARTVGSIMMRGTQGGIDLIDPCYLTFCDYLIWAQVQILDFLEGIADSVKGNN